MQNKILLTALAVMLAACGQSSDKSSTGSIKSSSIEYYIKRLFQEKIDGSSMEKMLDSIPKVAESIEDKAERNKFSKNIIYIMEHGSLCLGDPKLLKSIDGRTPDELPELIREIKICERIKELEASIEHSDHDFKIMEEEIIEKENKINELRDFLTKIKILPVSMENIHYDSSYNTSFRLKNKIKIENNSTVYNVNSVKLRLSTSFISEKFGLSNNRDYYTDIVLSPPLAPKTERELSFGFIDDAESRRLDDEPSQKMPKMIVTDFEVLKFGVINDAGENYSISSAESDSIRISNELQDIAFERIGYVISGGYAQGSVQSRERVVKENTKGIELEQEDIEVLRHYYIDIPVQNNSDRPIVEVVVKYFDGKGETREKILSYKNNKYIGAVLDKP